MDKLPSTNSDLVLGALMHKHVGHANGVKAAVLATRLGMTTRRLRGAVTELRRAGHPICGEPATGYYIATAPEDVIDTCAFLRARALHSLRLASALSKRPLAELVGQLQLDIQQEAATA